MLGSSCLCRGAGGDEVLLLLEGTSSVAGETLPASSLFAPEADASTSCRCSASPACLMRPSSDGADCKMARPRRCRLERADDVVEAVDAVDIVDTARARSDAPAVSYRAGSREGWIAAAVLAFPLNSDDDTDRCATGICAGPACEVGRVEAGVEIFDELSDEASAMRAMAERPEVVSRRACPPASPLLAPPPVSPTTLLRLPAVSGAVVNDPMLSCWGSFIASGVAASSVPVAAGDGLCASPCPSRDSRDAS